jgi:hypothetical protein
MIMDASMFNAHRLRIPEFARTHRLPTVCGVQAYAEAGCLIAYAPNILELVRAGDRPQGLRQPKGDQKIRGRQEQCPWLCQPACRLFVLTRGTMPIFAGMITVLQVTTGGVLIDMPAQSLCTALGDGWHGLQVAWWHTIGKFGTIRWAIAPEDCRQLDYGRPPKAMRDLPGGDGWPRWPRLQLWRSSGYSARSGRASCVQSGAINALPQAGQSSFTSLNASCDSLVYWTARTITETRA